MCDTNWYMPESDWSAQKPVTTLRWCCNNIVDCYSNRHTHKWDLPIMLLEPNSHIHSMRENKTTVNDRYKHFECYQLHSLWFESYYTLHYLLQQLEAADSYMVHPDQLTPLYTSQHIPIDTWEHMVLTWGNMEQWNTCDKDGKGLASAQPASSLCTLGRLSIALL